MEPSPAILGRQDIRGSVEITVSKNSKWHMIILHGLTLLPGGEITSKLVLNAPPFC